MELKINIPTPQTRKGKIALAAAFGFAALVVIDGYHANKGCATGKDGWQYTKDVAHQILVDVGLRPDISQCQPPEIPLFRHWPL